MIPTPFSNHRADYDESGNIRLPGFGHEEPRAHVPIESVEHQEPAPATEPSEPVTVFEPNDTVRLSAAVWEVIPETDEEMVAWDATALKEEQKTAEEIQIVPTENPRSVWREARRDLLELTNGILEQGTDEYRASLEDSALLGRSIASSFKRGLIHTKRFLLQPVWVPGRHNAPKKHSRGALFAIDIVRFGGTFASLFLLLFVSLNYQSFWTIAMARINPVTDITTGKELSTALDNTLQNTLTPAVQTGAVDDESLINYLPPVGPPEDRLIIPKLGLNVPIIIPPTDALMNQDWKKLEDEIQQGLQNGVVHYPGTANPGQAGNFFVTGHSSYFPWDPGKYKSVFARLSELNVGDEYWVYYGGDKFRYIIQNKKEIEPSDVTVLDQPINQRISTLMTCTPVGTALRRLIITAQEVDPVTGLAMQVGEHDAQQDLPKVNLETLPI